MDSNALNIRADIIVSNVGALAATNLISRRKIVRTQLLRVHIDLSAWDIDLYFDYLLLWFNGFMSQLFWIIHLITDLSSCLIVVHIFWLFCDLWSSSDASWLDSNYLHRTSSLKIRNDN